MKKESDRLNEGSVQGSERMVRLSIAPITPEWTGPLKNNTSEPTIDMTPGRDGAFGVIWRKGFCSRCRRAYPDNGSHTLERCHQLRPRIRSEDKITIDGLPRLANKAAECNSQADHAIEPCRPPSFNLKWTGYRARDCGGVDWLDEVALGLNESSRAPFERMVRLCSAVRRAIDERTAYSNLAHSRHSIPKSLMAPRRR
jgi:hypothetical protein